MKTACLGPIRSGTGTLHAPEGTVTGEFVTIRGETWYRIGRYDLMPPFFMSVVSGSDHWFFVSSTGGLTAGRGNADRALFPYYTDDRIAENHTNTGPIAIFLVTRGTDRYLWEPFSSPGAGPYRTERNLYKNEMCSALTFEEKNMDLGLTYRYTWRTGDRFGFVKTSVLVNDSSQGVSVGLLDGLRNILPSFVDAQTQSAFSNLLDAYKRNELEPETGIGLYSLSSRLTDKAEPVEALLATAVWQCGLDNPVHLLSETQLEALRAGVPPVQETDLRGRRGAYLVCSEVTLPPGSERRWDIAADVHRDASSIVALKTLLSGDPSSPAEALERDIAANDASLRSVIAAADGLSYTADRPASVHHLANVLFNTMRGGYFPDSGIVAKADLMRFIGQRNRTTASRYAAFLSELPERLTRRELLARAEGTGSADLERLCSEYLPLTFSRRHGDPSRPWNRFSINVKHPDGSLRLEYQGNWRDIFQNWEALSLSFPEYLEGMICVFLDATTADGYNPYRITREGIEWETPAPDNPWANIGYWGDHQIVYLSRLLELSRRFHPGRLETLLPKRRFSHAEVPYRIREYRHMTENPYDTIEFDCELDRRIERRVREIGTDGRLVTGSEGAVFHVTMIEKLLILVLAKLVNFVPDGGIWMNTQRPEWNDANNALAGTGVSVVTLAYLIRFIGLFESLVESCGRTTVQVTCETLGLFDAIHGVLEWYAEHLQNRGFDDRSRREMMDALGTAGSVYRTSLYRNGLSGVFEALETDRLLPFLTLARSFTEHTLAANLRPDALYHSYNTLKFGPHTVTLRRLPEMLEGQVAALSSGTLQADGSLALLESLRTSRLYRADRHSYTLYPDHDLPGFLEKNRIPAERAERIPLVRRLIDDSDRSLIVRNHDGVYRFNGAFRNADDVHRALDALADQARFGECAARDREAVLELFELTFDHASFTGRSGTFFAYEGLGSIYWHMVSKLLLAVQETFIRARAAGEPAETLAALAAGYRDIRRGLGFNTSPAEFGAFPTDPYSHTPAGGGARQPGMTGQVKEEILTRFRELGVTVERGRLSFDPVLLDPAEFCAAAEEFRFLDTDGVERVIDLQPGSLAFTVCGVPVVYRTSPRRFLRVETADGRETVLEGSSLDEAASARIFSRDGGVSLIEVHRP